MTIRLGLLGFNYDISPAGTVCSILLARHDDDDGGASSSSSNPPDLRIVRTHVRSPAGSRAARYS